MGPESSGLRFGVLGPLAAWRDGHPVNLGGERQRALLAMLVIYANELVIIEHLAEALFGEQRSRSAINATRVAVSRLRRALDDQDGRVLQTRPGVRALYRLRAA
jgi:DNA-binding SARP family transcriptional activator